MLGRVLFLLCVLCAFPRSLCSLCVLILVISSEMQDQSLTA